MTSETLRIVSLNTWAGRAMYPLIKFVERQREKTDVFCFQEVLEADQEVIDRRHPGEHMRGDLLLQLRRALPGYQCFFATRHGEEDRISQATFYAPRREMVTASAHQVFAPEVPKLDGSHVISPRVMATIVVKLNGRAVAIGNAHGLWNGGGKGDCPERLLQSRAMRAALEKYGVPWVLVGDMNLEPHTEAIDILAKDARSLVHEYNVTSTRTPLYRHHGEPGVSKHADYAFVSEGIEVESFEVLPDIASDHAALRVVVR